MSRFHLQISWNDVPHITAAVRAELRAALPSSEREARSNGIPHAPDEDRTIRIGEDVWVRLPTRDVEGPSV